MMIRIGFSTPVIKSRSSAAGRTAVGSRVWLAVDGMLSGAYAPDTLP